MKAIMRIGMMSLMAILLFGLATATYAEVTCSFNTTSPATVVGTASTYLRGILNVTGYISGTNGSANDNATTAILTAGAVGCDISGATTFNISYDTVDNVTNRTTYNFSVNTYAMKDDTTCTFTLEVRNISQTTLATCTRAFISDNKKPALTLTAPANLAIDTDGVVAFSYACGNTTSANIIIEGKEFAMTESSDVCSYTNPTTSRLTNGFQSWYIIASDGLNTTTSSTTKVEIRKPGAPLLDEAGYPVTDTAGTQSVAGTSTGSGTSSKGIGMVLVIGVIIYLFANNKKKK